MRSLVRSLMRWLVESKGEEGNIFIMLSVMLMGLVGFSGMVLDYGHAASEHRIAQNAADAAVLGAAYDLYEGNNETQATALATELVEGHGLAGSDLTLSFLDSSGMATTDQYSVVSVQATVSDTVGTFLMGIFGLRSISVLGAASSAITVSNAGLCAICVLDPSASSAFSGSGQEQINVSGGGIAVDSTSGSAATVTGGATITAPVIGVVGGYSTSGGSAFSPTPKTITAVSDPLSNVPAPTCATGNPMGTGSINGTQTIYAGTYDSITANAGQTITLEPGNYCILGTLKATGSGIIQGSGVMLYFTCGTWPTAQACTSGQKGGTFQLTGGQQYPLTPPTSGAYKGLIVFYDRNNVSNFSLSGSSGATFAGTIYCKAALVTITGGAGAVQYSMIVADEVSLSGGTQLNLQYNAGVDYQPKLLPSLTG